MEKEGGGKCAVGVILIGIVIEWSLMGQRRWRSPVNKWVNDIQIPNPVEMICINCDPKRRHTDKSSSLMGWEWNRSRSIN